MYFDSSAIVKRYILEAGSDVVSNIYNRVLRGEALLSFSLWNIGEVLGVLDRYYRRGWLCEEEYRLARYQFIEETIRFLKLGVLRLIPIRSKLLAQTWKLIERYHIYEADALQIVSAKLINAQEFYTGDQKLYEVAIKEGLNSRLLG
ncbi:MAG: type II toxin-antitoxin system VapC family toxin [Sulfolobales archaeon]